MFSTRLVAVFRVRFSVIVSRRDSCREIFLTTALRLMPARFLPAVVSDSGKKNLSKAVSYNRDGTSQRRQDASQELEHELKGDVRNNEIGCDVSLVAREGVSLTYTEGLPLLATILDSRKVRAFSATRHGAPYMATKGLTETWRVNDCNASAEIESNTYCGVERRGRSWDQDRSSTLPFAMVYGNKRKENKDSPEGNEQATRRSVKDKSR